MKKLAKWLFVGGCLLSVLGVILSLGDEALSPQVRRAIEAVNQTPEPHENGYFAVLTGIDVAAEEDPWEVGYQFAERYERALASFSQPPKDYPKSRRLPLPEDLSSLCKVESEPCLVPFVEASDTIRTYQAEHAVLLDRYRDLYDYPHFVTTNTLSLNLPLPRYVGLLKTQQLLLAILGVQFMTGDEERALTGLVEDISFQRRLLVGADNLLLKMVALSMLGRDLHLYAQMLDVEGFPYDYAALQNILYPPRQDELSLRKALQSEFRASAYLFLEEFPRQDLFASSQTPRESAPWESKIVTFIGFKPNATLNTVFDQILGAERTFAGLDGPEIAAYWKERQQARNDDQSGAITSLIFDWPFNPVGNILTAVSAPNYDQYLARLHDLNGFLRLIELKRIVRRLHIPPNKIELYLQSQPSDLLNPYTSEPMQYDEDRAMFYFEGLSGTEDPHAWRTRVLVHDVVSRP